jgi:hypothetical protein
MSAGLGKPALMSQPNGANTMETYQEKINRWRILRHEELPAEHKAAYRLNGINPDDNWSLIWSFTTEEAAQKMLAQLNVDKPKFYTYRLVDGGKADTVTRQAWF